MIATLTIRQVTAFIAGDCKGTPIVLFLIYETLYTCFIPCNDSSTCHYPCKHRCHWNPFCLHRQSAYACSDSAPDYNLLRE
jgi:hypothetical protein